MEDVKVDISGDMNVPKETKGFDLSSIIYLQKLPNPMEIIQLIRKSMRPWTEFFTTSNFRMAASMPRLTGRFVRNVKYFQSNYIFIFIILMIYCLVTSPMILIVICGVAFANYKIKKADTPVTFFGYQLTTYHQIVALSIAAIPVLFLIGAGSALFWTLGASCFIITLHAVSYNIDAIVTEETEGFLAEVV